MIAAIASVSHYMEHFHIIIYLTTKLQTRLAFVSILLTTNIPDNVQFWAMISN